jgi:hypothetical protein
MGYIFNPFVEAVGFTIKVAQYLISFEFHSTFKSFNFVTIHEM